MDQPVVRVFVSSTFRDMHAERDALNRVVFPELRSRCLAAGTEFVGVDLRWGIRDEDTDREGLLAVCLAEVERCRPFFVSLLGERFGWVPPPVQIPAEIFKKAEVSGTTLPFAELYAPDLTAERSPYRLCPGTYLSDRDAAMLGRFWQSRGVADAGQSITAREIECALFGDEPPAADPLVYLRRATPDLPPALSGRFLEENAESRRRLRDLKQRIRASGRAVVREYDAGYGGVSVEPSLLPPDIESFRDGVFTPEAWDRLDDRLRADIEERATVLLSGMDAFATMVIEDLWRLIEPRIGQQGRRDWHERFVFESESFFVGRRDEGERVLAYLDDDSDRRALAIMGARGCGKSAFVAHCASAARSRYPGRRIVPYFVGIAAGSTSLPTVTRSVCASLGDATTLRAAIESAPRGSLVLLDGLDQLDPVGRSHDLDWLPLHLPEGVKLVVSAAEGDCLEILRRHLPGDHVVEMPPLPDADRRAILEQRLGFRHKRLTAAQTDRLLDPAARPDTAFPLYLIVAIDELCLFGEHASLDERIDGLPATLPDLFDQVLARLGHDHGRAITESVFRWLLTSRSGLFEPEILDLLGGGSSRLRWTRFYRAAEAYLRRIDESTASGTLHFFHAQFRAAAAARFGEASAETHRRLAAYFRVTENRSRMLSELPHHLTAAGMHDELRETLSDVRFLEAKAALDLFDLVQDFQRSEGLDAIRDALETEVYCLRMRPELLPQQLHNRLLDETPTAAVTRFLDGARSDRRLWFRESERSRKQRLSWLSRNEHRYGPIAAGPRSTQFAVARDRLAVERWDVATRERLRTLVLPDFDRHRAATGARISGTSIAALTWLPRGELLAVDADGDVSLLDGDTGSIVATWGSGQAIDAAAIFADGAVLALAGAEGVSLREPRSGAVLASIPAAWLAAVAFGPDGRLFAAGADGDPNVFHDPPHGHFHVFDWRSGRAASVPLPLLRCLTAIAVHPNRAVVAVGDQLGSVAILDDRGTVSVLFPGAELAKKLETLRPRDRATELERRWYTELYDLEPAASPFAAHHHPVTALTFTDDGRLLASGSQLTRSPGELCVWNLASNTLVRRQALTDPVAAAAFLPGGDTLVTAATASLCIATRHGSAAARNERLLRFPDAMAVSPSGDRCALAFQSDIVIREGLATQRRIFAHAGKTLALDWNAVTNLLASAGEDRFCCVWNPEDGSRVAKIEYPGAARATRFSPDGRHLAVVGDEGSCIIVDLVNVTARKVASNGHAAWRSVAVSATGLVAAGGGVERFEIVGIGHVWDLATGRLIAKLEGHQGRIVALDFLASGLLATISDDGTSRVWDPWSGQEVERWTLAPLEQPLALRAHPYCDAVLTTTARRFCYLWLRGHAGPAATLPLEAEVEGIFFLPDKNAVVLVDSLGEPLRFGLKELSPAERM